MNAYERLVLAAAAGVEPDANDLAAIKPPPGDEPGTFRRQAATDAAALVADRRAGINVEREARELAANYTAAFKAAMPEDVDAAPEDLRSIGARIFGGH